MHNLGNIDSIAPGHGRCFQVNGEEIAVFRQRNGQLFALQNLCPHRQGPLADGIIGDGKVVCPLHGHKFHLSTGAGSEPSECVRTYLVQVRDGEMFIQL